MAENSKIEWTTHTANLWWGCQKVHAGCDHCYAETLSHRWGNDVWGPKAPRRAIKAVWSDFNRFQREAAAAGRIDRVFVGSMMDIFEKPFPLIDAQGNALEGTTDELRQRFFAEVVPNCPNLLFLLLTKRPGNILKYIPESWKTSPPANVMYGTSVVNQETADEMIPKLLEVPGRRFLSMEPLLGPVLLNGHEWKIASGLSGNIDWLTGHESQNSSLYGGSYAWHSRDLYGGEDKKSGEGIDWVIVGGESGHGARPMAESWAQHIAVQCEEAGVPYHFKQWGEWAPWNETAGPAPLGRAVGFFDNSDNWLPGDINPSRQSMVRVGKHEAGRQLNGRTYDAVPLQ